MHTNHRRRNPRTTTKREGGRLGWLCIPSMKPMKIAKSRLRRSRGRQVLLTQDFDEALYPVDVRNILWEYW